MVDPKKWKFSWCRLIATVGMILLLIGLITMLKQEGGLYLNIPALIFAIGVPFFLLLGSYGMDFLKFIPDSVLILIFTPSEPNPKYVQIAKFGSRYVIGVAVLVTIMSIAAMLRGLAAPYQIGYGIAVALEPLLYGVFLSEIYFAYAYKTFLGKDQTKGSSPLPLKNAVLPTIVIGVVLLSFFIGILAYTPIDPESEEMFIQGREEFQKQMDLIFTERDRQ